MSAEPQFRARLPAGIRLLFFRLATAPPAQVLVAGYASYVLVGWLILCLPVSQANAVGWLDNLFIAASAVSTTGLVTIDPGSSYTGFGELVVLLLIQLGGIGYMTAGSFVVLASRFRLPRWRQRVLRDEFHLPGEFDLLEFLGGVVLFTLVIEGAGTLVLFGYFVSAGAPDPLWSAVFHSISAFCTAGFSLYSNSFENYPGHIGINMTLAVLSYLGGVGFIVCLDIWHNTMGVADRLSFTSRVILWVTLWFTLAGTVLLWLTDPLIRGLPVDQRLVAAFFQTMSATTTVGFNTVPIGKLSEASQFLLILLMIFGASPSGTGGGLKSTNFAALLGLVVSTLRGRSDVRFWNHEIQPERVRLATATAAFYLIVLGAGVLLLLLTQPGPFLGLFFEAASALGTVGLSMGATGTLSDAGKWIVIALMFIGRTGVITFGMVLARPDLRRPAGSGDLVV